MAKDLGIKTTPNIQFEKRPYTEPLHIFPSLDKLREDLGDIKFMKFEEGVRKTLPWMNKFVKQQKVSS